MDAGAAAAEQPPRRRGRPPKQHGSAGAACGDPSSNPGADCADAAGVRGRPGAPLAPGVAECQEGKCEELPRSAVAPEREAAAPAGAEGLADDAAGEAAAAARLPDPDPGAPRPDVAAQWWAKRWSAARSLHALQTLLARLEVGGLLEIVFEILRSTGQGPGCCMTKRPHSGSAARLRSVACARRQQMRSCEALTFGSPWLCAPYHPRQARRIRLCRRRSAGLLLFMRAP